MFELFVSLNLWDSFYGLLSAMMQPIYWVISGLVVLFHRLFTPLFGADSGVTWTLAIIMLTVVIRTALIPLFVKQINSARNMQLMQPSLNRLCRAVSALGLYAISHECALQVSLRSLAKGALLALSLKTFRFDVPR